MIFFIRTFTRIVVLPICLGSIVAGPLSAQDKSQQPPNIRTEQAAEPEVEKQADKQAIELGSDDPAAVSPETRDPLQELRWMIGQWHDPENESAITIKCEAFGTRGFLKREYKLQIDEETSMEVIQMIGYDPVLDQIQSWIFDSEGGYGTAVWKRNGNQWTSNLSFQLATGETASSTNVMTKVDENTLRWKSVNRLVGSELQPSVPEVTFVRKADAEK